MTTLDLDAVANKYAVYTGTSDAPLYSPLSNLPSLLWHSDLPYIGKVATLSGSVNLNDTSAGWSTVGSGREITIGAHGQSYRPAIIGNIILGGETVPVQGTFHAGGHVSGGADQFSFYTNATSVILRSDVVYSGGPLVNYVCNYTIHILNIGSDSSGNAVFPAYYNGFDASDTRLRCGYFDTDAQYIVKDVAGAIGFTQGATLQVFTGLPKYITGTFRGLCSIFKYGSYTELGLARASDTGASFTPTAIRASLK